MSHYPDPTLPPPRWRGARTKGGCGRMLLFVGVGAMGLMGAWCCLWAGLVHATVDDVVQQQQARPRSTVPEPLRIAPDPAETPRPRVDGLEVRQGLRPMPAPQPPAEARKDRARSAPGPRPVEKKRTDEGELFGF